MVENILAYFSWRPVVCQDNESCVVMALYIDGYRLNIFWCQFRSPIGRNTVPDVHQHLPFSDPASTSYNVCVADESYCM